MPTDTRIPPKPRSELNDEQKTAHDEMSNIASSMFKDAFTYKRPDGAFIGPFAPLLATPHLTSSYFDLVKAIGAIGGLPATARETTILATGSRYKAVYEIYAHERVAVATTALNQTQVDQIKMGKKPGDLDTAAAAAFDVAIALSNKAGPLDARLWEALVKEVGKEGALACVHYVGVYAYTCVLLNACDIGVPDEEEVK